MQDLPAGGNVSCWNHGLCSRGDDAQTNAASLPSIIFPRKTTTRRLGAIC